MSDPFASFFAGIESPATKWAAVTPHNTNELATTPRALWVGTSGDLVIVGDDGVTATFKGAVGLIPVRAKIVKATGTTATDIVALT